VYVLNADGKLWYLIAPHANACSPAEAATTFRLVGFIVGTSLHSYVR
jgi:hypothetical protein